MDAGLLKSRLAPTPSGYLHEGNLCSFLRTWLIVRKAGGTLLLRIDDIDQDRSRPEYVSNIFEWLHSMGLDYDEGPVSPEDFYSNWSQQQRLPLYEQLLTQLADTRQVYACRCSRSQLARESAQGKYPGTCRNKNLPLDEPETVWRLHVPDQAIVSWKDDLMGNCTVSPAAVMGDFVIRRKNGRPSYQVASLADDLHFNINYIVRGQDLLASTAAQLYMAYLTGAERFQSVRFAHHPLMTNESGIKLSKSAGHGSEKQSEKDIWRKLQGLCYNLPEGVRIQNARDLLSVPQVSFYP